MYLRVGADSRESESSEGDLHGARGYVQGPTFRDSGGRMLWLDGENERLAWGYSDSAEEEEKEVE